MSYTPPKLYYRFNTQNLARFHRYSVGGLIILFRWTNLAKLLFLTKKYDIIFMQKITPPVWYSRLLRQLNKNIVFDIDDAVFLKKKKRTRGIVRKSRLILAGSHYNLDWVLKHNERAHFLPTPVPVERFKTKENYDLNDEVIIGWLGSVATLTSLNSIAGALEQIGLKYDKVLLRIIGFGNRKDMIYPFENIRCDYISRIPYETVPDYVVNFDIGIMPLLREEWEKGKCVGKALEYMAAGVPSVISRFGENVYAVEDGKNGFLASDEDEWINKISLLIDDVSLRKRLGRKGKEKVETDFSVEHRGNELIKLMNKYLKTDGDN